MSADTIPIRPPDDMPEAPDHLSQAMRAWWAEVVAQYVLASHHTKLLLRACECFDIATDAREVLAEEGATVNDRFGQPKPRPEAAIWRENVTLFARLVRELQLEDDTPQSPRPSRLY